ncbi:MAG: CotH kinase family protein [Bacteroidota bacterium]
MRSVARQWRTAAGLGVLIMLVGVAQAQTVQLNEVVASNRTTLFDEDGETPDWIELHNPSANALDLTGYGLSDDEDDPFKWTFQGGALGAGAHALVLASGKDRQASSAVWETVVREGDMWRYNTAQPVSQWVSGGYNASHWQEGPSGFGYADGDDNTVIQPLRAIFIRTAFTVADTADVLDVALHVDYDDGFVAYLNGTEIARSNIGTVGDRPRSTDFALGNREAGTADLFTGVDWKALLRPGENIVAVQGHNISATSSDFSLIPSLSLLYKQPPADGRGAAPGLAGLAGGRTHTNFRLSAGGEALFLTAPDGSLADSVRFGVLPGDAAWGRTASGEWRLFASPTPGATNAGESFLGVAPPPVFSAESGRYLVSELVTLTAPVAGAEIRFTQDGTPPTAESMRYTAPFRASSTRVVRARTFAPGYLPSAITTQTYLYRETITLPVISIAMDPEDLFDWNEGIYVLGPNAEPNTPHFGANFWQDWEKPAHIDFFEPRASFELEHVFGQDIGVKIFGAWSRARAMKSLALFARGSYGNPTFDYPLFPDRPFDAYSSVILRNSGNDFNNLHFRDAIMHGIMEGVDLETQAYRPVVVFLNGDYWGIHNMREKINEDYLAQYHPVDPDAVDIIEDQDFVVEGSLTAYNRMLRDIRRKDLQDANAYAEATEPIDIENFIDYQVAQNFFVNTDWPGNNIKFWRPQTDDGQWRWALFDTDFGLGGVNSWPSRDMMAFTTDPSGPGWPNPDWSTELLRELMTSDVFRRQYMNRYADHLNTTFRPERTVPVVDRLQEHLRREMSRHWQRWGGQTEEAWDERVQTVRDFLEARPRHAEQHLTNYFRMGGPTEVNLDVTAGGRVQINDHVTPNDYPWEGTYFQNVEITLTAVPRPGYRFVRWTGSVTSTDRRLTLNPTDGINVTAEFAVTDAEVASGVIVSEIMYNASDEADSGDWVELYNTSGQTQDLSGWLMRDEDDSHTFEVPAGVTIAAEGYVVLCRDPDEFTAVYGTQATCIGPWDFGLGGNDQVRLYGTGGGLVDSVAYGNRTPWPVAADGAGYSIEVAALSLDNDDVFAWRQSDEVGGTPAGFISRVDTEAAHGLPERFSLVDAYPNPFNATASLVYDLPRPAEVQVRVYNVLGQRVAEHDLGARSAGAAQRYLLEGADWASGVYLVQFVLDGEPMRARPLVKL